MPVKGCEERFDAEIVSVSPFTLRDGRKEHNSEQAVSQALLAGFSVSLAGLIVRKEVRVGLAL